MLIVVAGASGFLGSALTRELTAQGHLIVPLRRSSVPKKPEEWNPRRGQVDQALIDRADVVINLAGYPISAWPRTQRRRHAILRSRVETTATLADAIARSSSPPTLLNASGMSWYGTDRGGEVLDEGATSGTGFLAGVAHAWESAAQSAIDAGARVVFFRTSLVLDNAGGALPLMRLPFAFGLGGRLGSGRQYFSHISLRDWVGAAIHLMNSEVAGAVNMANPHPVTNREFTKALGHAMRRPAFIPVPAFALRLLLGSISDDLLGSLRLRPQVLLESGYTFSDPTVAETLRTALADKPALPQN